MTIWEEIRQWYIRHGYIDAANNMGIIMKARDPNNLFKQLTDFKPQ